MSCLLIEKKTGNRHILNHKEQNITLPRTACLIYINYKFVSLKTACFIIISKFWPEKIRIIFPLTAAFSPNLQSSVNLRPKPGTEGNSLKASCK